MIFAGSRGPSQHHCRFWICLWWWAACIILLISPLLLTRSTLIVLTKSRLLLGTLLLALGSCTASTTGGTTPEDLEAYKSRHYAALPQSIQGVATNQDMLQKLTEGSLLLLGDIHDDKGLHLLQSQVLQQLIQSKRKLLLHLEFVGTEDEPALDAYMSGAIDLDELRLGIQERWPGSWMEFPGFDAQFYQRILITAKDKEIGVRALEPIPRRPLERRDQFMALGIRKAMQTHPDHLHIVIIGHTHLMGDGHLVSLLDVSDQLVILPRGGTSLTHRLGKFASLHSAAWHAPYLVLDEELWLLNPLPLRSLRAD